MRVFSISNALCSDDWLYIWEEHQSCMHCTVDSGAEALVDLISSADL